MTRRYVLHVRLWPGRHCAINRRIPDGADAGRYDPSDDRGVFCGSSGCGAGQPDRCVRPGGVRVRMSPQGDRRAQGDRRRHRKHYTYVLPQIRLDQGYQLFGDRIVGLVCR